MMAAQRLVGALIGFGQAAEKAHAPAFRAAKDFSIAAVADSSPVRRRAAAQAFPGARIYEDSAALLEAEPDLDFADIATPPYLHEAEAKVFLKRGLHVLCEKPLTLNTRRLEELRRLGRDGNLALWTVHNWAYAPQWLKIKELAGSGALGKLQRAEFSVLRTEPAGTAGPLNWRRDPGMAGGGILADHGWHNLYLVHQLLGPLPSLAVERFSGSGGVEDSVALRFRGGVQGAPVSAGLALSWRAHRRANRILIVGDRGSANLEDDLLTVFSHGRRQETPFAQKLSQSSAHPDWFSAMLPDFRRAVLEPPSRRANEEEAEFCCRMITAVYQLAAEKAAAG